MNAAIHMILLVALVTLGIVFANRWLVNPPLNIKRFSKGIRIITLIFSCWIGTFVVSAISNRIGYMLNDGVVSDDGAEVPYDVMHDGVGANVFNIFFGWGVGLISWRVAVALNQKCTEQVAASDR